MPAWIKCPHCEEYFCTLHLKHVPDCKCPPIEEWPVDPYGVITNGYRKELESLYGRH